MGLIALLADTQHEILVDCATVTLGITIASAGSSQVLIMQWNDAEFVVKEPFQFVAGTALQDLINKIQNVAQLKYPNFVWFSGVAIEADACDWTMVYIYMHGNNKL